MGNDYLRLILECLKVWGEKFKNNKQEQPTKFRKFYNELVETKVVLPTEFKFFHPGILGNSSKQETDRKISSTSMNYGKGETSSPSIR